MNLFFISLSLIHYNRLHVNFQIKTILQINVELVLYYINLQENTKKLHTPMKH